MTAEPDCLFRRGTPLFITAAALLISLPAEASRTTASLIVTPAKRSLTLATDAGTKVRVALEPISLDTGETLPRVSVSVGTAGEVTRTGPGKFEFDYFIPERKPPSVCILVARFDSAPTPLLGAAVIKLFGQARVDIKTEEKATVRLRVAGKIAGPFQADASGIVETSITVPPGVNSFQVLTVDAAGNRSKKKKNLAVPPFPGVGFGPTPAELVADGKQKTEVAVVAVSPKGDLIPFRGKCKAAPGKMKPAGKSGDISLWFFRSRRVGTGMTRITCRNPGGQTAAGKLELALVAGPADSLEIAGPASVEAGSSSRLEFLIRDAAANPVTTLPELKIAPDHGEIIAAEDPESGFSYIYVAPKKVPAGGVATLSIEAVGAPLSTAATIELLAGPLDAILVDKPASDLTAISGTELEIPLRFVDAFGNRVELPAEPIVTAVHGKASWHDAGGENGISVTYVSPRFPSTDTDHLEIRVGEVHSQITVGMPYNQGRGYVSIRGGAMMLRNGWVAPAIGIDVATSLPFLRQHLAIGIKAVGTRAFRDANLLVDGVKVGRVHQTIYAAPILFTAEGRIPLSDAIDLSIGGGGGGMISWTQIDSRGDSTQVPPVRESRILSPAAGLHIRAGFDLGSFGGIEVGLDGTWAQTHTAKAYRGDLTAVSLTAGWRLGWKGAVW